MRRAKHETIYSYQKKIRELQAKNTKLNDDVYQFRQCASEIYQAVDEAVREGKTSVHVVYLLRPLKRAWRSS